MKNFNVSLASLLFVAALFTLVSCGKEKMEEPQAIETTTTNLSKTKTTTGKELNDFLLEKFGKTDFSYEEKMKYAEELALASLDIQLQDGQTATARTDQYVLVSQAFRRFDSNPNNDIYNTEVTTSHGLPANWVKAYVSVLTGSAIFVGANSNVYLNGSNIAGQIINSPDVCSPDDIKIAALTRLFSDGSTQTDPVIRCDD